jgi:solute carrier family 25 (mitochondrial phosphate transporter), member 23/24/25/41
MEDEALVTVPAAGQSKAIQSKSVSSAYSTLPSIFAGGFSSAATKTMTAPLSRMTILMQVSSDSMGSSRGILSSLRSVVANEGYMSLWKGNLVSVIHKVPYGSVNYYAYETAKVSIFRSLWNSDTDPGIRVRFLCGLVGGACASSITYPLDIVRTRLATASTPGGTILGTARDLVASEGGLRALAKGLPATVLCQSTNLAINFAIYESLQVKAIETEKYLIGKYFGAEYVTTRQRGSWLSSLICAGCAGTTASLMIFPLDLIRRRQQISSGNPSIWDITRAVVKDNGLKGLYRGIVPELVKVVPAVAMNFYFYELFRQVILKNVAIAPR